MYLHEFQSKNILKENGINVPESFLLKNINDIEMSLKLINSENIVLKAQIHSGSRMKNGGILFLKKEYKTIYNQAKNLFNKLISTNQTGKEGKTVNEILVEEKIDFEKSFYLSLYIDREIENLVFLVSYSSGINIEDTDKENFLKVEIGKLDILEDYQIREIIFFLKLEVKYFLEIKKILTIFLKIFITNNLLLLEINPLVLSKDKFICLDSKMEIDDNSYYKNELLFKSFDSRQENPEETEAKKYKLNYINLDGNIGCLVNGAGLAMSTMDLINLNGGKPLNFLDIGGDADYDRIYNAIKIISSNKKTKCILINIFGGIIKCDIIAESLIKILKDLKIKIPIVIRLVGNMSEKANKIITESDMEIKIENNILIAVKKAINLAENSI